jgi:hypothetical protein
MKRSAQIKSPGEHGATRELPYLRFYHSKDLRTKTLAVLDAIDKADDATEHSDGLADVVLELTETGLTYYFLKPVQAAKGGFLSTQTTKVGIGGILRVMGPVVRRVLGGMNHDQLLEVSRHIRALMR